MSPVLLRLLQKARHAIGRWERQAEGFAPAVERRACHQPDFYFIQIGANDGVTVDPLRAFILKYHWHGVLIEPQKKYFERLVQNYAGQPGLYFENVAISAHPGVQLLITPAGGDDSTGLMATLKPQVHFTPGDARMKTEPVTCVTLASIIAKYAFPKIDLLQIDTEGYDYEILMAVDFASIRPHLIHYEHRHLTFEEQFKLKALLRSRNYLVVEEGYDTVAHCA